MPVQEAIESKMKVCATPETCSLTDDDVGRILFRTLGIHFHDHPSIADGFSCHCIPCAIDGSSTFYNSSTPVPMSE